VLAVRGRRHSVTELTLALPHSAEQRQGWPPPGVDETAPGRDSQARQSSGATCCVRALNARTRVGEQVRAGALDRGGPRSRGGAEPSSGADPARGGVRASSEAGFTQGAFAALS
jgi:hypothetical protein